MSLPSCGLYRTTVTIGSVTASHLVYFHNHGDPGPGIYLPETWRLNRAIFSKNGTTLPDHDSAETLAPLAAEGLYRVEKEFTCCEKRCATFSEELLVQLGYNRHAEPILFRPVWTDAGLSFPEKGQMIDSDRVGRLVRMVVALESSPRSDDLLH